MTVDLAIAPIYQTSMRLPRRKGATTIFHSGLDDSALRRLMKALFPGQSGAWHGQKLTECQQASQQADNLYQQTVENAFLNHFGRKPTLSDYQVSGIYSQELPEEAKTAIRAALTLKNNWADICTAHRAATRYNS